MASNETNYFNMSFFKEINISSLDRIRFPEDSLLLRISFICENVLMPVICCLGICGNTLSLCVLTRREMTGVTMCFLMAMAVSDLLLLTIQVPVFFKLNADIASMSSYKRFYRLYEIVRYGMNNIFITCTSWLTVAVATERLISLRFVIYPRLVCTIRKARLAIVGIFIVSFIFHFSKFFEYVPNPDLKSTKILVPTNLTLTPTYDTYVHVTNITIDAIIPVILLLVANSFLIYFLINHKRMLQHLTPASSVDIARVIAIVVATVLVFIMCHSVGVFLAVTIASKGRLWVFRRPWYIALSTINTVLVMVNSSVNFIIYCAISRKFRKTFLKCVDEMPFVERVTGSLQ